MPIIARPRWTALGCMKPRGLCVWLDATCAQPMPGIPAAQVTWSQLAAATEAWTPEALVASHTDAEWRRFEFHGVFVSCMSAPQKSSNAPLANQNMPLLYGHAMVWSWYWRMGGIVPSRARGWLDHRVGVVFGEDV